MRTLVRGIVWLLVCAGLGLAAWAGPQTVTAPSGTAIAATDQAKVSLSATNLPLREALRQLLAGTGITYAAGVAAASPWLTVEPDVPDARLTVTFRELPLDQALRLMARAASTGPPGTARLKVVRRGANFLIGVALPAPAASIMPPLEPEDADARLTLDLERVPFRKALAAVFAGTVVRWSVAEGLPEQPITLKVQDMRRRSALLMILRQEAQADSRVALREDPGTGELKIEHEPMWCGFYGIEDIVWSKIPLQYLDAVRVSRALGGIDGLAMARRAARHVAVLKERGYRAPDLPGGPPQIGDFPKSMYAAGRPPLDEALVPDGIRMLSAVRADNSLIVSGPPEDLENLQRVLRLIDIPERTVRVRVSFGAAAAVGKVLDDHDLHLSATDRSTGFEVTARPAVRNAATELVIEGRLRCGGAAQRIRTTISVRGIAVRVLTVSTASGPLSFWVRAEPEK